LFLDVKARQGMVSVYQTKEDETVKIGNKYDGEDRVQNP
jgi:hypothetical protein